MKIRSVPVLKKKGREKCNRQPPNNTERPPYQTASAHPDSRRNPAKQRFHNISQKGANKKQPEKPDDSAFFPALCFLGFRLFRNRRINLLHTPLYPTRKLFRNSRCPSLQTPVPPQQKRQLFFQMINRHQGTGNIYETDSRKRPDNYFSQNAGQDMINIQYPFIQILNAQKAQKSPEDGILQADISGKIPLLSGIIPPLFLFHLLQKLSGKPFHGSCNYPAAQKQEKRFPAEVLQEHSEDYCGKSVDKAKWPGGKSPVSEFSNFYGGCHGFRYPCEKSVGKKQGGGFVKCIVHYFPSSSVHCFTSQNPGLSLCQSVRSLCSFRLPPSSGITVSIMARKHALPPRKLETGSATNTPFAPRFPT